MHNHISVYTFGKDLCPYGFLWVHMDLPYMWVHVDFFTCSHSMIVDLQEACQDVFVLAADDIKFLAEAVRDQNHQHKLLNKDMNIVLAQANSSKAELLALKDCVASIKSEVGLHVHEISSSLEVVKGDVREASWIAEGDFSSLRNLVRRQSVELGEFRRETLVSKENVRKRDSENTKLQEQLEAVSSLAEVRKHELESLCAQMHKDREVADDALTKAEGTMTTIALVRDELRRTAQERDLHRNQARTLQDEAQLQKATAEHQIMELRDKLHTHIGSVQERIMALQSEIEELHSGLAGMYQELGVLSANFQCEVANLNGKMRDHDLQRSDMCHAMEVQEYKLACREAEMQVVSRNLETLMTEQMYAASRFEDLQVQLVERLRDQRTCTCKFKFWYNHSRRRVWMRRAMAAFQTRHITTILTQNTFRLWTRAASRSRLQNIVSRWEVLAVGSTVLGLDRHALSGVLVSAASVKKRTHRIIANRHPVDSRHEKNNISQSTMTSALQRVGLKPRRLRSSNEGASSLLRDDASELGQTLQPDMSSSTDLSSSTNTMSYSMDSDSPFTRPLTPDGSLPACTTLPGATAVSSTSPFLATF